MLRSPALESPDSLSGQLDYIRTHWSVLIGEFLQRLLSSMDMITEEELMRLWPGPGPAEVIDFNAWGLGDAPERFSEDSDWMPRLVLLAKNAYVWLDQLSRQYQRQIRRLDQIPDEELDRLANQGITGLWLIGLWRRSNASRRIKQMMGDPDAIASAYSLDDYDHRTSELGGAQAIDNLRQRAMRRGIRLGGDMVPNHMAIDSRWVIEHPQWFLGLDHAPFPGYTFNGPNLSGREDVGIYLEDQYYSRSDAAVVFKRVDFWSGRGTIYLPRQRRHQYALERHRPVEFHPAGSPRRRDPDDPACRPAVPDHPLRRRHDPGQTAYPATVVPPTGQRRRNPLPGRAWYDRRKNLTGPSRKEFWREVVDRVAAEVPDTLAAG